MKIIQLSAILFCLFAWLPANAATNSLTCKVAGCSNELCVSKYGKKEQSCKKGEQPIAALKNCYKDAHCTRQQNGNCEWSVDEKLSKCVGLVSPHEKPAAKPGAHSKAKPITKPAEKPAEKNERH